MKQTIIDKLQTPQVVENITSDTTFLTTGGGVNSNNLTTKILSSQTINHFNYPTIYHAFGAKSTIVSISEYYNNVPVLKLESSGAVGSICNIFISANTFVKVKGKLITMSFKYKRTSDVDPSSLLYLEDGTLRLGIDTPEKDIWYFFNGTFIYTGAALSISFQGQSNLLLTEIQIEESPYFTNYKAPLVDKNRIDKQLIQGELACNTNSRIHQVYGIYFSIDYPNSAVGDYALINDNVLGIVSIEGFVSDMKDDSGIYNYPADKYILNSISDTTGRYTIVCRIPNTNRYGYRLRAFVKYVH